MTINTASRLIGSTVVAWDDESQGYVEGKLREVFADSEQAKIQISSNGMFIADLANVSEGGVEDVVEAPETDIPYQGRVDEDDEFSELV